MSIKHNLFACLGRKGIIATTTGMIAVGGAGLAIEKITKPDNKKHTEEAVVSINAGGKNDYETTLSDISKIAEGEGDDNSFNIVMLPVFEKSADLSFFNEIMTGIETDTSFDRLLEEGGSSIEQAIIEKSRELEKAKKNNEGAEERYKTALDRVETIAGEVSLNEYLERAKAELVDAKNNYQKVLSECEELLQVYNDEHALAVVSANSLKESLIAKANSEYEEVVRPYIAKYEGAISLAKQSLEDRNLKLKENYDRELEVIEEAHKKAIDAINQTYSNNSLALKTAKEAKLSKALSDYETAVSKAEKSYEEAIQKNEEQYNIEVSKAREKYNSDTEKDQEKLSRAIEEASKTYNDALIYIENSEEYQELKKAKDLAQYEYDAAVLKKNEATNSLTDAQKAYNDALKKQENTISELDTAKKEVEQAKTDLESIKKQIVLLEDKISEEKENNETLKTEFNNAVSKLEEKRLAVEAANGRLEELKTNLNSNAENIENAKLKVEEAQAALVEADEEIASGVLGFYRSQYDVNEYGEKVYTSDVARAIDIINYYSSESVPEEIRTVLGDSNDATSLENMKKSLEILKEGNSLRVNDENFDCSDWLVTNKAMANAQVSANAENVINGHWSRDAEYNYLHPSNINKTEWGTNAENAAWGWEDPYDGWYKEEKTYYDFRKEYKASNPTATEEEIVNAAKQEGKYAYISGGTTGHYVAMENKYLVYTGLAINSEDGFNNYTQEFDKTTNSNALKQDSKAYTIEEYYSMFMTYYNEVYAKKEAARNALEKAQANLASIQANGGMSEEDKELLNKAKTELVDAEAEYISAKEDLDNAGTDLALSSNKINSLNSELEYALEGKASLDAVLEFKENVLEECTDNFNKVAAEVETTKSELEKMDDDYAEANKKVENAENKLANAEAKLNDAEADIEAGKEEALNVKEEAIADAYDEYALNTQKANDKLAEAIVSADNKLAINNEEAKGKYEESLSEAENEFEENTANANNQYENDAQSLKLEIDEAVAEVDVAALEGQSDAEDSYDTGLAQSQKTYEDELIDAENEFLEAKDTLESQKEDAIAKATEDCSKATDDADAKLEQNTSQIESLLAIAESGLNDAQSAYDNAVDVADELETARNELEIAAEELTDAQNALDTLVNGNGAGGATLVVEADGSATLYISEASE